jgi:Rho termination factor, N-terminal domain
MKTLASRACTLHVFKFDSRPDLLGSVNIVRRQIMPSWTNKERRQYEHIKESSENHGKSEDRAEEIAARTVNKGRRQRGETPQKTTQGTGNPNESLESRRKQELYNIAQEMDIKGRSKMDKQELISAIRKNR